MHSSSGDVPLHSGDGKMKRMFPLALILISAWFYLIVSSFLILKILFEFPLGYTGVGRLIVEMARVGAGVIMFLVWLIAWKYITRYYFIEVMKRRGITLR